MRLIAQDKSSKEIAQEMGIARKTVDSHRSNICRKLENQRTARADPLRRPPPSGDLTRPLTMGKQPGKPGDPTDSKPELAGL